VNFQHGSNHKYAFSGPTVVANSADWLYLSTFPPMGDALPQTRRLLHLEKWFCHKSKLVFWPFILNQTMNADILSPLQWHIVLTGSTQISVRPCNGICYTRTTLFNTWKTSIAMNISRYFHHFYWTKPWLFWTH